LDKRSIQSGAEFSSAATQAPILSPAKRVRVKATERATLVAGLADGDASAMMARVGNE
jgi:hypothetical protein